MSNFLGTLTITANTRTTFTTPVDGLKAIRIGNESGLTVIVSLQSGAVEKTLYPSTVDWFPVRQGYSGTININPMVVLNNVTTFPASELLFDAIGINESEDGSQYPMALPRVTNQGNSAVVPGASTSIVNDGNAANTQILEATVSGDGSSAVLLTNDGKLTIGTTANPGQVSFDNGKISSDGAGHLTLGRLVFRGAGTIARIAKDGPFTVTQTLTTFSHSLGATPDFVIPVIAAGSTSPHQCYVNFSTLNSSTVQLQGDGTLTVYILSIQF